MASEGNKPKESEEVLKEQLDHGMDEYRRSNLSLFLSSTTAGLEIGFSILLMGILYTVFKDHLPEGILHLVVSFGYPLGFIFVIIGGSQLFTEQTSLAVMPVLNGKVKIPALFKLWFIVFFGNIVGGSLFALLITWIGPSMNIIDAGSFSHFAEILIAPNWYIILGSATMAGWLMGLMGWLIATSQESITRIILVGLIALVIGFGKLHHSIVGSVELVCAMLSRHQFDIGMYSETIFLSVVGNIIGGTFFVAVLKYSTIKT